MGGRDMLNLLWAAAAVLVILWVVGFALNFTVGGLLHVLLVLAVVAIVARLMMGRQTTA